MQEINLSENTELLREINGGSIVSDISYWLGYYDGYYSNGGGRNVF